MDNIRPEWRSLMLFSLRLIVQPLVRGTIPCPKMPITDQAMRGRLLEFAPDVGSLLEQDSISAVALMEAYFAKQTAKNPQQQTTLRNIIQNYHHLDSIWASRPKKSSKDEVLELVNHSKLLLEGASFHPDRVAIFSGLSDDQTLFNEPEWIPFFQWYFGTLIVSLCRWGIPFPWLLCIAKEGPDPIANGALFRTITVEKMVIGLPWVQRRLQQAEVANDRTFMRRMGEALAKPAIPKELRARALDYFLCVFNIWLNELPLKEQAALIREGGIKITAKALRNRRSRLGLTAVDKEPEVKVPPEIARLIEQTQRLWEKPFSH